jgi:linoleoyl-CoA desaturase
LTQLTAPPPLTSSSKPAPNKLAIVRFASRKEDGFFDELKQRVQAYFANNNISELGNATMRWKTVAMLAIYFVPFVGLLTVARYYPALSLVFWFLMGVGMVGIGTSVMHDSNHGAYFSNKRVNKFMGNIINLLGGYAPTWKIQHNILHHTYTNIEGLDHDLEAGAMLRFHPHGEVKGWHKYQHFYAWFLYGFLTLQWCTIKDYRSVVEYNKIDMLKKEKLTLKKAIFQITASKILYYAVFIALPLLVSGLSWGWIVGGFVLMHFVAGLSLSAIFQLAHVMEGSEFPVPQDNNKMENNWAVHQIKNTINFAPRSRFLSWFIGGLNYQIEHHLFPHICHVHYPKLSFIVRRTATKYGIPYQVNDTLVMALADHTRMLRKLGRG